MNEVLRRHEVLRTTFELEDGELVQVISGVDARTLPVADLRDLHKAGRMARADDLTLAEAKKPFNLVEGPLFRASLVRIEDTESLLLMTMHHIVCDGWSLGLLVREVGEIYDAFSHHRPSPLPELPIQYADFASWQQEWLEGADFDRQLDFWKGQLANGVPVLDLATDRPRRGRRPGPGAMQSWLLSRSVGRALKDLCQREDATMYMLLLAAFKTLLHRYTGQEHIVAGSPSANRNQAETEGLIGLFVNVLLLQTDLSGNPSFRELLGRVREATLEAFAHHDVPFERLADELNLEGRRGNSPLIQVMFIYQAAFMKAAEYPEFSLSPERSVSPGAIFEMTQSIVERDEGLRLQLEYNTDLFDDATAGRFLEHYRRLIEAVSANPDARLSDLSFLTDAEQANVTLRADASVDSEFRCIEDIVAAHAARAPQSVAVRCGGTTLTYGELDRRSNQLARLLSEKGVGRGAIVGLVMEPSVEMTIGLVGIAKAGGCCAPLDPSEVAFVQRLPEMGARVAVVDAASAALLRDWPGAVVSADARWAALEGTDDERFEGAAEEDAPAVALAAGAGRALVSHHAAVAHGVALAQRYGLRADDRVGRIGSIASISLIEDLVATWVAGASVVFRPSGAHPSDLGTWIATEGVSVLSIGAGAFADLVERLASASSARLASLRLVATGGARIPTARARAWSRLVDGRVALLQGYRVAEAGGTVSVRQVSEAHGGALPSSARIGRPIAGAHVVVLDAHLRPVPVGVRGEIYVGGNSLAGGYVEHHDPAADAFVSVEGLAKSPLRLFRTGDAGRYAADGGIELLGRAGEVLTLHGFRCDPALVAAVLEEHPLVTAASVVARQDALGEERLCAFYVPALDRTPEHDELRSWLDARFPAQEVPTAFMPLRALPLGPDGRVDGAALRSIDIAGVEHDTECVAPRDDVERTLVEMWERALNRSPIGIRDSFFDLGGHSLLAARLFGDIEKSFGKSLPLSVLFQCATIEHLATFLGERASDARWSPLAALQPHGSKPPFFAGGSNARYADVARKLGTDQPFYGLDVYALQEQRLREGKDLYTDVEPMARYFVERIRKVQPVGPYYLGGGCEGGTVAFEVAQQLQREGEDVAALIIWETPPDGRFRLRPQYAYMRVARPARDFIKDRLRKLKILSPGTDGDVEDENGSRNVMIRKANIRAVLAYKPPVFRGRVVFLQAEEQPPQYFDACEGWDELASAGMELHTLPGNHTTYFESNVEGFAEWLEARLGEAQRRQNAGEALPTANRRGAGLG